MQARAKSVAPEPTRRYARKLLTKLRYLADRSAGGAPRDGIREAGLTTAVAAPRPAGTITTQQKCFFKVSKFLLSLTDRLL